MFKKVLVTGLYGIAGFMATKAVLDKLDLADAKRKDKSKKVIDLIEKDDITEEEIELAMSLQQ